VRSDSGHEFGARAAATPAAPAWLRGLRTLRLELPIKPGAARPATLHVEADFAPTLAGVLDYALLYTMMMSAVVAALLSIMLSVLRRSVHTPTEKLMQVVRETRVGEAAGARPGLIQGEFAELQHAFDELLERREASESNLRAYKADFERRVRERTQELDTAVAAAKEAANRAEGASRAKSDFLARMSHEIRTPLNGVLGMAELLQDSPKLDEQHRRYALVIHQSGRALLQLINDLLDFSKIEAGKLLLDKERFCVREMIEDTLELMAERAHSKGLELLCDIPADLDTEVQADSLRLRQVVINLLGNAVKFTERGDICVRVRAESGIETSTFQFEVRDTGIGIRPENCASIFDAFVQEDSSPSRRYGGTGLGLAICRQLVELMGGTINVRSSVGVGSTFYFSVPLAVDRTASRKRSPATLPGTRVLVVEKSVAAREMLRQHLKSWGAVAIEVGSAHEALARLGSAFAGEFELVMLDAQLPGTTPFALVAQIRALPGFADTPILIMNAGSGDPPPEAAGQAGLAWQNKPLRRSLLRRALGRLLKLEAEEDVTRQLAAPEAPAPRATAVRRVLVIEDNPVNREVVTAMLQKLAVEVHSASSGEEGLQRLSKLSVDAVLMDCQMPVLDGYQTTLRLREWELVEQRPRVPVVALTANALAGDAEKCFAAGMDHYLSKPFALEQLRAVLDACGAPRAPAAASPAPAARAEPPREPGVALTQPAEVLDAKVLARIRQLSPKGGSELLTRLHALYVENSRSLVDALRVAGRTGDTVALSQAAHALKSSSANVGATALAALCTDLEKAAQEGRVELATNLIHRLIGEHREVLHALEEARLSA
jgi:two-component system, sensor histidine kinase and response regulator